MNDPAPSAPEGDRTLSASRPRLDAVDLARGAAVVAMAIYHTAWDLGELQLIPVDVARQPGWLFFARAIAATFLTLVGVGLVLAHGDGVRLRSFARRLALVAAAALAVTAATALAFPASYVFFGILHNIALSSALALPLVRAPLVLPAGLAVVAWAAPLLFAGPVFDAPALAFLGLGERVPNTNDYVPVFPWSGFVFAGVVLARLALPRIPAAPEQAQSGPVRRALAGLGRHSLLFYLLHQPVLFGLLWGVLQVTGPHPAAEAEPVLRACRTTCAARGGTVPSCETGCSCAVEALKREGLWTFTLRGQASPAESTRAAAAARACFPAPEQPRDRG
jgi:uncharacterized membrane protein